MEELRGRWELPSISHFVASFHGFFDLPELHVEELENALLTSCTSDGSDLLNQLIASLLSGFYNSKTIEYYNYESSLRDYLHQKWVVERKKDNPMVNRQFKDLDLSEKVDIVYALCVSRLDADDVADATKSLTGEDMRVEPVGYDAQGSSYWNFNDERLYKETAPEEPPEKHKKKKKHKEKHKKKKHKHKADSDDEMNGVTLGKWSLVCSSEQEWQSFVKELKKSAHKQDKKLRKILANDFVPLIAEIIEEKEKAMKRRLLEMLPKRESDRLARKRAEMNEQKALLAKLDAEDREERRQREIEKKRLAEQKRKADMAREREERILAREHEKRAREQAKQDRALRVMMRESKLAQGPFNSTDDGSWSDESSEETDWENYNDTAGGSYVTPSHRQRSRRNRQQAMVIKNNVFGLKEYEKINRILYQLQKDKNCGPFLDPVTKDMAPDYFDIINQPMDLSAIRKKTSRKEYFSRQQFVDDFNLIVDNCLKYNGRQSDISGMALGLKERFDGLMNKSFPEGVNKSVRRKVSEEAEKRVSYTEQLTDSSDESNSSGEETGSNSSYEQKKKTPCNNHPRRGRPVKVGRPAQGATRKRNNAKMSTPTESSESESDDDEGSSEHDSSFMSNNALGSARSLGVSQSHQILTDEPVLRNVSTESKLLFGIARKAPAKAPPPANTPQPADVTPKVSVLSSTVGGKVDHSTQLARWTGKSQTSVTPNISNGTSQPSSISTSPATVVQPITRPQPLQGLYAQLKRSSTETSNGPLHKRVA